MKLLVFKNNVVTIFIMSLGTAVIGFTSAYFIYTVHVKGGDLLLQGENLVSWTDDDPSLVSELDAV